MIKTSEYQIEFTDLPIKFIEEDPHQPRTTENTDKERKSRLMVSIRAIGLQQPIAVSKVATNKYLIIDGHRRYRCARDLNLEKVPCRVYPKLQPGELERVRFEIQNNRRQWKPPERAKALARIKHEAGITNNKDLAKALFITDTLVSTSLRLNEQSEQYQKMIEEYDIQGTYLVEFLKLLPKIRPVGNFGIDDIVRIIFKKTKCKLIGSAKDYRTLGRIFMRASANQEYILEFLNDDDMNFKLLELDTVQSGFSLQVEKIMDKMRDRRKRGATFSEKDEIIMRELQKMLNDYFTNPRS